MLERQLLSLLKEYLNWEDKTMEKTNAIVKLVTNIGKIDIRKLEKFLEDELK